jgi:hypothetical protein
MQLKKFLVDSHRDWHHTQERYCNDYTLLGQPVTTVHIGKCGQRQEIFSLLEGVQIDSGAHSTSYGVSTGGSFPGIRRPEHKVDRSTPVSAGAKNSSFPECIFMA